MTFSLFFFDIFETIFEQQTLIHAPYLEHGPQFLKFLQIAPKTPNCTESQNCPSFSDRYSGAIWQGLLQINQSVHPWVHQSMYITVCAIVCIKMYQIMHQDVSGCNRLWIKMHLDVWDYASRFIKVCIKMHQTMNHINHSIHCYVNHDIK